MIYLAIFVLGVVAVIVGSIWFYRTFGKDTHEHKNGFGGGQ